MFSSPAPSSSSGSSGASANSSRSVHWGDAIYIEIPSPVGSDDFATPDVARSPNNITFPRCNLIEEPSLQLAPYELKQVIPNTPLPLEITAESLPWTFNVEPVKGSDRITIGDILSSLYNGLRTPVTSNELSHSSIGRWTNISQARATRVGADGDPQATALRRIDFLEMKTTILGFTRSEKPGVWYLKTADTDASP